MKHRPCKFLRLTSPEEQLQAGSSGGAPRPQKDNKGAQRLAQVGQKSTEECKGISQLDSEPDNRVRR